MVYGRGAARSARQVFAAELKLQSFVLRANIRCQGCKEDVGARAKSAPDVGDGVVAASGVCLRTGRRLRCGFFVVVVLLKLS